MVWNAKLSCDCLGSPFVETWLKEDASEVVESARTIRALSAIDRPVDDAVLFIDFLSEAPSSKWDLMQLRRVRSSGGKRTCRCLTRFVDTVSKTLVRAVELYGAGSVVVLAALHRFEDADEDALSMNWALEEAYDAARDVEGVVVLPLPNCLGSLDPLAAGSSRQARVDRYDTRLACDRLERMARARYAGELEPPRLSVSLEGASLSAKMTTPLPEGAYWARMDLMRDGRVVERVPGIKHGEHIWELSEAGIYVVQAHLAYLDQKSYVQSEAIWFETTEERARYDAFMKSTLDGAGLLGRGLYYAKPSMPICDYLVVSLCDGADTHGMDEYLASVHGDLHRVELGSWGGWKTSVLTDGAVERMSAGSVLFSGGIVLDGTLYEGPGGLPENVTPDRFDGACGEYTALWWDRSGVRIDCDLFRFSQLYEYRSDTVILYSGSYRLLLEAVHALDAQICKLDEDKAAVTLGAAGFQVMMQNYSYRMDVAPLRKVPYFETPVLDKDGWKAARSFTGRVLGEREVFHEETYRSLLDTAIAELEETVGAYLDTPLHSTAALPLTGGLDSRLLASIARRLPDARRPGIVCWDLRTPSGIKDRVIGTSIAGRFGFDYLTASLRQSRRISIYEEEARIRSARVGSYYSNMYSGRVSMLHEQEIMQLYGACGEVACRPYVAARYFDAPVSAQANARSLVEYMRGRMMQNVLVASDGAFSAFDDYYAEALENLPGLSPFEQVDRHYMDFRHSVHFAITRTGFIAQKPMQSPTMLKLSHLTFDLFKDRELKLNLDLLYLADPEMAQFPFEDEANELARAKMLPHLVTRDKKLPHVDVTLGEDERRWRESLEQRGEMSEAEPGDLPEVAKDIPALVERSAEYALQHLLRLQPSLAERIGPALYHAVTQRTMSPYEKTYLYNKIVSILDQVKILAGVKPVVLENEDEVPAPLR